MCKIVLECQNFQSEVDHCNRSQRNLQQTSNMDKPDDPGMRRYLAKDASDIEFRMHAGSRWVS